MLDCSACDAEAPCLAFMGQLGDLVWFRCVHCGGEQSREASELREWMGDEEFEGMLEDI
jgi:hypothetical protein